MGRKIYLWKNHLLLTTWDKNNHQKKVHRLVDTFTMLFTIVDKHVNMHTATFTIMKAIKDHLYL
jgi:hypothetical protein